MRISEVGAYGAHNVFPPGADFLGYVKCLSLGAGASKAPALGAGDVSIAILWMGNHSLFTAAFAVDIKCEVIIALFRDVSAAMNKRRWHRYSIW